MATRAITFLFIIILFVGCGRDEEGRSPEKNGRKIVRVGDAVLTVETLENLLPEVDRVPFAMNEKRYYVRRWIETEILYQEALRRGLKGDPRIRARLRSLEQGFLADHLTFIELRERTTVTEEEIEDYFNAHEKEYLYEYRVRHILVGTQEAAENVMDLLERNSFQWVANRHSIDPVARRTGHLRYGTGRDERYRQERFWISYNHARGHEGVVGQGSIRRGKRADHEYVADRKAREGIR